MQYQLDLQAYRCPVPLLMTKKALQSLAQGDQLLLLLNAEAQLQDFVLFCQQAGYQYQVLTPLAEAQRLQIHKG